MLHAGRGKPSCVAAGCPQLRHRQGGSAGRARAGHAFRTTRRVGRPARPSGGPTSTRMVHTGPCAGHQGGYGRRYGTRCSVPGGRTGPAMAGPSARRSGWPRSLRASRIRTPPTMRPPPGQGFDESADLSLRRLPGRRHGRQSVGSAARRSHRSWAGGRGEVPDVEGARVGQSPSGGRRTGPSKGRKGEDG